MSYAVRKDKLGWRAVNGPEDVDVDEIFSETQPPPIPPSYRDLRAGEYPPMADYLDAQVKKGSADPAIRAAGVAQEQAYYDACATVKSRYPK